jgi:hypothetical protein
VEKQFRFNRIAPPYGALKTSVYCESIDFSWPEYQPFYRAAAHQQISGENLQMDSAATNRHLMFLNGQSTLDRTSWHRRLLTVADDDVLRRRVFATRPRNLRLACRCRGTRLNCPGKWFFVFAGRWPRFLKATFAAEFTAR